MNCCTYKTEHKPLINIINYTSIVTSRVWFHCPVHLLYKQTITHTTTAPMLRFEVLSWLKYQTKLTFLHVK